MLKGQSFGRRSDGIRDAESSAWFRRAPDRPRGGFGEGPCCRQRVLLQIVRLAGPSDVGRAGGRGRTGGPARGLAPQCPPGVARGRLLPIPPRGGSRAAAERR